MSKSQIYTENLPLDTIEALRKEGFTFEPISGIYWYFADDECPTGIELKDGKWFPCNMFPDGEMQYSNIGYDDPVKAARESILYFS